jgi:hypothetical protein
MMYEIWPRVTVGRQLDCLVGLQWPELKMPNDRPPWFIDSNLFVQGACADALRIKNIKSVMDQDPWFNPELDREYESMYQYNLQMAANADEAKAQRAYSHQWDDILAAGGAQFWVGHDPDLNAWNL